MMARSKKASAPRLATVEIVVAHDGYHAGQIVQLPSSQRLEGLDRVGYVRIIPPEPQPRTSRTPPPTKPPPTVTDTATSDAGTVDGEATDRRSDGGTDSA